MGCIPRRYLYPLHNALNEVKARLNNLHQISFTHEEYLAMFAPEDDHRILKEASKVAHVGSGGGQFGMDFKSHRFAAFGSNEVGLNFTIHEIEGWAPLMHRNTKILRDAPVHLVARLEDWVLASVEHNFEVSRASSLLSFLDENCETPRQVRYLWPSILALCAMNESTMEFGDKLRPLKVPRALPAMDDYVKAAFKRTAGIIAGASLLPHSDTHEAVLHPVAVRLTTVNARKSEGALGCLWGA